MKKFASIAVRLGAFFLLIALIPVLVTALFSSTLYTKTIQEERTEALSAVADATRDRIEDFILTRITDVNALSNLSMWVNLLRLEGENVIQVSQAARLNLMAYISEKEYYDLLLIDLDGMIRLTVKQERNLGLNIYGEELNASELTNVVDASITLMQTEISNFANYSPSEGFAAFIASPIFDEGRIIGSIVLQVDQGVLTRVINRYQGIGETGDILTGTRIDGSIMITTPSRFDPDLALQIVDEDQFPPLTASLMGDQGGGIYVNHRGHEVLAEWRYLPSLNWGMVVMVNTAELYAATTYFFGVLTWIVFFAVLLAIGGAILTYKGVSGPLVQFANDVKSIKKNRLPESVPIRGRFEIAELGKSFNTLLSSVRAYQSNLESEVDSRTRDLKEALQVAETANRAKGVFLATMSHEIRTPLNGVIGFTELLKDTPLNEKQRIYVESAQVSGKSLLRIINDVLDISKIEAGGLKLELDYVDLRKVFRESMQIIATQAKAKNLKLVLEIEAGFPWLAEVDETRLKQVCVNLLSNAVKFTEHGEVCLTVTAKETSDGKCQYRINVIDTGIGIHPQSADKLFSAFSQADSSTSRKYGGTGLGLTISRLLVEKMNGEITLKSTPGNGTTFTVNFEARNKPENTSRDKVMINIVDELLVGDFSAVPLQDSKASSKSESDNEPTEPGLFDTLRILVAEDTPLNMMLIKAVLKARVPDALILEAKNGKEAVDIVTSNTVDMVLMDVNMPEMDGLDATRAIRKFEKENVRPSVPIVALTAGVLVEDRNLALESGMNGFLTKPLNVTELKDVMITLLGEDNLRFKD
ncbi:MAG: response regulator [Bacteroidetes bacterium]|nr:response regulator [Bacteroidota bacterium]MCH8523975.1 response regulator [Balneolales bacterium]